MRHRKAILIALGAVLVLAATPAWAIPLPLVPYNWEDNGVFRGSMQNPNEGGSFLQAEAEFVVAGNLLHVYLRNISEDPVSINSDLLHGVFFSAGGASFEGQAAMATQGLVSRDEDGNSVFVPGSAPTNVGNAFGYQEGLDLSWVVNGGDADRGIAGVGYDFGPVDPPSFGGATVFPGGEGELFPPDEFPRKATRYGIVPGLLADNYWGDARGNVPEARLPVVYREMHFTFTGATDFQVNEISNVAFAYGTDLEIIPEPATMTLLGLGLAGLGARHMRRRSKRG